MSVPYEELPRELPCESTAREAVEQQLGARRRLWMDEHAALGRDINMHEPVLVTHGTVPALAPSLATLNSRQEIFAHCRHLLPELISGAPD